VSGGLLQGILAEGLGLRPARRGCVQSVATARPAPTGVPKNQWQRAIGRRLLTPAEEAARDRYFLSKFTAAMGRFAAAGRRRGPHHSAA